MSQTIPEYSDRLMDHFLHPRNFGDLPDANAVAEVGAVSCGDIIRLSLKIENDSVIESRFRAYGCGFTIAVASLLTELLKDKTVEEARQLTREKIIEAMGELPPMKMHCPVLAEEVLKMALNNYRAS
jgi:NifU-like protein involved in Fe-S cluster formation